MKYRVLELFSGSGSLTRFCSQMPELFETVRLDIDPRTAPDILMSILDWDYTRESHFDIIWASPDCREYSIAHSKTPRDLGKADMLVRRTLEIIAHFQPKVWFIENPQTGLLKSRYFMGGIPFHDVTYCMYGYAYRKATRIWTNVAGFTPLFCRRDCVSMANGRHLISCEKLKKVHIDNLNTTAAATRYTPRAIRSMIPQALMKELMKAAALQMQDLALYESVSSAAVNDLDWSFARHPPPEPAIFLP